ncbi:helix-turn-helix domain-containing protein [Photorhabdus khanii]|uniref:helix-turn-helix domain-containing protein n=1 Tax=Photorhabdus khanii TaxID=1004150 RepID=UPI0039C2A36C
MNSYLASSTLSNALQRPWHKGETIIANALGQKPEARSQKPDEIWPSRYQKRRKRY